MTYRFICLILICIIVFQSCAVYDTAPISIEEANEMGKLKYIDKSGTEYKLDKIVHKDDIYYGVKKNKTIRLDTSQIETIYLKNIGKSTAKTIFAAVFGIPGIALLGGLLYVVLACPPCND